jgi:hypothetical protein
VCVCVCVCVPCLLCDMSREDSVRMDVAAHEAELPSLDVLLNPEILSDSDLRDILAQHNLAVSQTAPREDLLKVSRKLAHAMQSCHTKSGVSCHEICFAALCRSYPA